MTAKFSTAAKLETLGAVIRLLHAERPAFSAEIAVLREIEVGLRAETPRHIGRVLEAMTFQVEMAQRSKARLGFIDNGNMQTLVEGLLGRWWPVVERALQQFEKETAET